MPCTSLAFRAHHSFRAAQTFRRHDERALHDLSALREQRNDYLSAARQRIEELERVLLSDREDRGLERDAGWDAETLREEFPGPAPCKRCKPWRVNRTRWQAMELGWHTGRAVHRQGR